MVTHGYCHCGCGKKTRLQTYNDAAKGYVKGQPKLYLRGHYAQRHDPQYVVQNHGYATACWQWQWCKNPKGYGVLRQSSGKNILAHRYYYERYRESVPDGYFLDHLCRNPSCVNPSHLEIVTLHENLRRGNGTKLNESQVRALRQLYAAGGVSCRQLGEAFGVAGRTVQSVIERRNWKDVS